MVETAGHASELLHWLQAISQKSQLELVYHLLLSLLLSSSEEFCKIKSLTCFNSGEKCITLKRAV